MADGLTPNTLGQRPKDRRGLPIPYTTSTDTDGNPDFTAIDTERVVECLTKRLCGLCGQKMGYWVAFLGGSNAADARAYVDPPMHEECAEAATRLCPHIARRAPQRATRTKVETFTPKGFMLEKPDVWVMGITRTYELVVNRGIILTAPFKRTRTFIYNETGDLEESSTLN